MSVVPGVVSEVERRDAGCGRERMQSRHQWLLRWPWPWLAVVLVLALLGLYNGVVYHPHLDQSHRFAILALLFDVGLAAAVVWCGLLLGLLLLRWLRLADRSSTFSVGERVALAAGLGLGGVSLLTLGLGAVHLYYGTTFAVLLMALPLLLRREAGEAGALLAELTAPPRTWRPRRGELITHEALLRAPLVLICAAVAVQMLTIDTVLPFDYSGYDTYQYHWAVPLLLLRAHSWLAFPGWAHANLPFGAEMLNLIALSLGAPQAATMIQDSFLLLTSLLLFALIRRSFGSLTAWLAVIAVVTIPVLLIYSDQSYVESALIFYGVAALVVLLRWLEHDHPQQTGEPHTEFLLLAGIYLGLALSVKYTAVQYLPAAAVMVLAGLGVYVLRVRRTAGVGRALASAGGAGVVFGLAIVAPLAPWLLKNWVLLGDPVYPALSQLFPTPLWDAARTAMLTDTFSNFGRHTGTFAQLHLFALDMYLYPQGYGEGTSYATGGLALFSMLLLPFGVSAIFGWLRQRRGGLSGGENRPWPEGRATVVVGMLALWVVSTFGMWTASGALVERYALPGLVLATALGATLLGWINERIPDRLRMARWPLVLIVVAVCASSTIVMLFGNGLYYRNPLAVVRGSVSEQAYFRSISMHGLPPDYFQVADYINGTLPHDGKLLMLGRGTGYFFTDRDYVADSGGDWVPYLVSEGKTPDGILRVLHQQHFTYVVYDAQLMRFLTTTYGNRVLAADLPAYLAFQQQELIPVGHWGDISLYRVP